MFSPNTQPTGSVTRLPVMEEDDIKLLKSAPELISEFTAALPKFLLYKAVKTSVVDRLTALLELFKENPQLLDPNLSNIVTTLTSAFLPLLRDIPDIRNQRLTEWLANSKTTPLWRAICLLLSTLCKVRGYKTITRFFDNRPQYLEPMIDALDACIEVENLNQDFIDEKYIILLWVWHLMLTPYDIAAITARTSSRHVLPVLFLFSTISHA